MKINKNNLLLFLFILILLSACNSTDDKEVITTVNDKEEINSKKTKEIFPEKNDVPVGLNKISFTELEKKLKNKDSFWLVTIDYYRKSNAKEIGDEMKFEKIYNEALKERNMGAYYVNMYEAYDENNGSYPLSKEFLNENYSHIENEWAINLYASEKSSSEIVLVTNYGIRDLEPMKSSIKVPNNYEDIDEMMNGGSVSDYGVHLKRDIVSKITRNQSKVKKLVNN